MIIEKVHSLANEHRVDADVVEGVYRNMINAFINLELKEHDALQK